MRRRRPRKGGRRGEGRGEGPPPREATVIRVLIARRQLCFMRRSSRDITSLSLAPAFSYIIYYIGVLNACTFLFRQTVNIIFDVAPFMRQTKEVEMFLRNREDACSYDDICFCTQWRRSRYWIFFPPLRRTN